MLLLLPAAANAAGQHQAAAAALARVEAARVTSEQAAKAAASRAAATALAAQKLTASRIAAAARLQELDGEVRDASDQLAAAREREQAARAELVRRSADLEKILPVALRLSRFPAETIIAAPVPPDQAVAGLLLLRSLGGEIARQAKALQAARNQAASDAGEVSRQQANLAHANQRQLAQAATLDRQLAQNAAQGRAAEAELLHARTAAAAAAAESNTLRQAIAAMERAEREAAAAAEREAAQAARHKHAATAAAARARAASLAAPAGPGLGHMDLGHNIATGITLVAGKIVKNFGAATEAGPTTGMTIAASPGAVVLSPCQGRVGFAAPFRSYGKLIILECGHGDDFVLAGLGRLDAAIGQAMSKGEPLGRMGEGSPPVLYLELRRAGTPVDPAPFLALR